MSNYEITIVVPVYKTLEKLLRGCIESIVNYRDANIELILVDDGTPDNGGTICDEYAEKFSNVTAYHQENQGVSIARNYGIEMAQSEFICFVDADDVVNISAVIKVVRYMKINRRDIVVFKWRRDINFVPISGENTEIPVKINEIENLIYSIASQVEPFDGYCFGSPWGKVFRKRFLIQHDLRFLKSLRKMQDRVFMMYCLKEYPSISMYPIEGYCYIKNEESIVNKYNSKIGEYLYNVALEIHIFNNKYNAFSEKQLNTIVCKILLEYLGINILHLNNPDSILEKKEKLRAYCELEIFKKAIKSPDLSIFGKNDKAKILLLRMHLYKLMIMISVKMR